MDWDKRPFCNPDPGILLSQQPTYHAPTSDGRGSHPSLVDEGFRCVIDVPALAAFGR